MFSPMQTVDFQRTTRLVLTTLAKADWKAFTALCAPEIVMAQYTRAYPSDFQSEKAYRQAFGRSWFSPDVQDESSHRYFVVALNVDVTKHPAKETLTAFLQFCKLGQRVWTREIGENVQGWEVPILFGPAIEGEIASNYKWRIEFENIAGQYKVRRLVIEMH